MTAIFTPSPSSHPSDPSRLTRSARATHISRTTDILHLALQRGDLPRARKAWSILIRCKEFDWRAQWRLGLAILADEGEGEKMDYLQKAFLACPEEKEAILKEIVLSYIAQHRERAALDQLELYLQTFPFQDNPSLHIYAGMLALYLSQQSLLSDHNLLRSAKQQFLTSLALDPGNPAANGYQELVGDVLKDSGAGGMEESEGEESVS